MNCKRIRDLIDSTDRTDVLPHEAARHVDSCQECAGFAEKRMRLRELLASSGRVTAPANFDAMLRVRLTERSESKPLPWMVPALYLRFGGAAIALVCVFLIGQQLVRNRIGREAPAPGSVALLERSQTPGDQDIAPFVGGSNSTRPSQNNIPTGSVKVPGYAPVRGIRRGNGGLRNVVDFVGETGQTDPGATTAAVLLMRGPGAEREIMIPVVSVGAQPIFYPYREPQPSRGGRVTF